MALPAPRSEANEADLALLIADLSRYTALTEAHGAFRAAEIIDRFERIAEGCREPGVDALALGERRFKNVSFPVALFDLVQSAAGTPAAIDPVCRMQVHLRSDHLKVEHAGTTYVFCSHECAQAFNEAPGRFVGTDGDKAL